MLQHKFVKTNKIKEQNRTHKIKNITSSFFFVTFMLNKGLFVCLKKYIISLRVTCCRVENKNCESSDKLRLINKMPQLVHFSFRVIFHNFYNAVYSDIFLSFFLMCFSYFCSSYISGLM